MELFFILLNHMEHLKPILEDMQKAGFSGATVIDATGMLRELDGNFSDDAPVVGMLRHFHDPVRSKCKLIMSAIKPEDRARLSEIVNKHTGGMDQVDAGIAFSIPLANVYGLHR